MYYVWNGVLKYERKDSYVYKVISDFFIIGIGSDYLFKSGGVDFLKSFSIALGMSLGITYVIYSSNKE